MLSTFYAAGNVPGTEYSYNLGQRHFAFLRELSCVNCTDNPMRNKGGDLKESPLAAQDTVWGAWMFKRYVPEVGGGEGGLKSPKW